MQQKRKQKGEIDKRTNCHWRPLRPVFTVGKTGRVFDTCSQSPRKMWYFGFFFNLYFSSWYLVFVFGTILCVSTYCENLSCQPPVVFSISDANIAFASQAGSLQDMFKIHIHIYNMHTIYNIYTIHLQVRLVHYKICDIIIYRGSTSLGVTAQLTIHMGKLDWNQPSAVRGR